MLASKDVLRIDVQRGDWINYRVKCPACGETIGARNAIREYADLPPDPPYAVVARCPRAGHLIYVEFKSPD